MALKITLKPHERMVIGGAVLTNANSASCDLVIENKTPILRQKDILSEEENWGEFPLPPDLLCHSADVHR